MKRSFIMLEFMTKISKDQSDTKILNNTFRYLDDILALNNDDFSLNTKEIYPVDLTLNKANTNNEHCHFLDLDIYIINGKLNTKIYDKRYDFTFPNANYPFFDGDVPLSPSYGVYISQLVGFTHLCNVLYFSERNLCITEKLLHQGFLISQTSQN